MLVGMGSPQTGAFRVRVEHRGASADRVLHLQRCEFADTAEWVGTVPDGIGALIDGRVGWDGAPQSFDDLARGRSAASKILVFPAWAADERFGMTAHKIAHVRAFTVGAGGGADYHDQQGYHWIDDHIATPMSRYPGYEESRRSFGLNVLGTLVVQVEADDGTTGLRRHHGRGARSLDRRATPGAVPGRRSGYRHREDLGPDVSDPRCSTGARGWYST